MIVWPWLIIGLIRNLHEKVKDKQTKIQLSRKLPQVMQTQHIPIPVCLTCVFSQVVTDVGCLQYNTIVSQIINLLLSIPPSYVYGYDKRVNVSEGDSILYNLTGL